MFFKQKKAYEMRISDWSSDVCSSDLSVSVEDTFFDDLTAEDALIVELDRIAENLWGRIEKSGAYGRPVVLKVKFADFRIITRSRSFAAPLPSPALLAATGRALRRAHLPPRMGARLLGVGGQTMDP